MMSLANGLNWPHAALLNASGGVMTPFIPILKRDFTHPEAQLASESLSGHFGGV